MEGNGTSTLTTAYTLVKGTMFETEKIHHADITDNGTKLTLCQICAK